MCWARAGAVLGAMVAGQSDPALLAQLAQVTARNNSAELREALRAPSTEHDAAAAPAGDRCLARTLAELDAAVGKALAPIRQSARLLATMPGVRDLMASVEVAEIGLDMSRFPTAGH
jgi:transposase